MSIVNQAFIKAYTNNSLAASVDTGAPTHEPSLGPGHAGVADLQSDLASMDAVIQSVERHLTSIHQLQVAEDLTETNTPPVDESPHPHPAVRIPMPHLKFVNDNHHVPPPHFDVSTATTAPTESVSSTLSKATTGSDVAAPKWQVEQFLWPKLVDQIATKMSAELTELTERVFAGRDPQGAIVNVGCTRLVGCTTVGLVLARQLSHAGTRVAIVDLDWERPQLAQSLGIKPATFLDDILSNQTDLMEIAISSNRCRVTLIPLRGDITPSDVVHLQPQFQNVIEELVDTFDVVILDAGPASLDRIGLAMVGRLKITSGGLLVRNRDVTDDSQLSKTIAQLQWLGIPISGIAENFHS